jgi:hypothetical protein
MHILKPLLAIVNIEVQNNASVKRLLKAGGIFMQEADFDNA